MRRLIFVYFLTYVWGEEHGPIVELPFGKIAGKIDTSLSGNSFYSFEGVPYARPPIGHLRFKSPQPLKKWSGVRKAFTQFKCMQLNQFTGVPYQIQGDEDCLYINIYTTSLEPERKLPVIIHIHGGDFMFNYGASQQAHHIMDHDIVYVSLNYRLGPLGFLTTEDDVVPGNNGLKDQIAALKYIKNYIQCFGGDPDSVTLTGLSAGGASVHLHFLMEQSRGLFHRGISQSGVALNPWILTENGLQKAKIVADFVGCPTRSSKRMVDCLKTRPASQIVQSVSQFQPWLYNPFSPFGVVIDSWASDPVLPDHPLNIMKNYGAADLPWIVSFTNSEGLYPAAEFYPDQYLNDIETRWNELMPHLLDYNFTVLLDNQDYVSTKVREFYMRDEIVSKSTFNDLVKIFSDRLFLAGIDETIRLQASLCKSPIYSYLYTYRGAHSLSELFSGSNLDFGAAHADDTFYIFNSTLIDATTTEEDTEMVKLLVNIFVSFAKTGVAQTDIPWPVLSRNKNDPIIYLRIGGPHNLEIETESILGNRTFWESLPINENEKWKSTSKTLKFF